MVYQPSPAVLAAGRASIGGMFAARATAAPDDPAITDLKRTLNYGALNARVNQLAHHLLARGVGFGDRVAMLARNCIEYLELELACAKIGAIVAAQNWRLADRELAHCLALVTPRLIVHGAAMAEVLRRLDLAGVDTLALGPAYEAALAAAPATEPTITAGGEDGLVILYTSGTTGLPKGALISHRAMAARALAYAAELNVPGRDNFVAWAPLFHMVSTDHALASLTRGGQVIVIDGFQPELLMTCLERYALHWLVVIPGMIAPFLEALAAARPRIKGVAMIGAMADLVPPAQLAAITRALNAPFVNSFGATETGLPPATGNLVAVGATTVPPKRQSGGCEIRLVGPDGDEVAPGIAGELAIRGPTLFSGYWRAEETNATDFRGGWFHMGDVFRRTDEGGLIFVDRVKYMIKSGGENIYPAEIEQVLLAHPGVAECAVIRRPDPTWGEVPVAIVARRDDGLEAADLMARCAATLSRYKWPRAIIFLDAAAFPRSTSGKIQRHALEAEFNEDIGLGAHPSSV